MTITKDAAQAALERIRDTDYLPDWAQQAAGDILAAGLVPDPPAASPARGWCPFASVTNDVGLADLRGFNRIMRLKPTTNGMALAGMGLGPAACLGDHCQMWDGEDCGLKIRRRTAPSAGE